MTILFYTSAIIALIAAVLVVTRTNAMHALIYLIIVFISMASVFWTLGAPFIAVLQIIVYAGAIMVLFVFAVMMLNLGQAVEQRERNWLTPSVWILPSILAFILLIVLLAVFAGPAIGVGVEAITAKQVGISLFTTYLIGVELASILLLAALVAAFHFGIIPTMLGAGDE